MSFEILAQQDFIDEELINVARRHLSESLLPAKEYCDENGKYFINKLIQIYEIVGSPLFINLDHNVSGKPLNDATRIIKEIETIVKTTAGCVVGYKMNFQSLLTFLIAKEPEFVYRIKEVYRDACCSKYGVDVEPVVWLDQKLADIPSTNFQVADILFELGFDALHVLPHVGPDSMGAVHLIAKDKKAGVVHVINMTHDGYKFIKKELLKNDALQKMRRIAMDFEYPVKIDNKINNVKIKAAAVIEPATRPYELYRGFREMYRNKVLIFSVGIGVQGALPGTALYAGASFEGTGRFIYLHNNSLDKVNNILKKIQACNYCCLVSLLARYSKKPYPLDRVLEALKVFNPKVSENVINELNEIYNSIRLND